MLRFYVEKYDDGGLSDKDQYEMQVRIQQEKNDFIRKGLADKKWRSVLVRSDE